MKKISINLRYIFLQGFYWMTFCACMGFISFYLQGVGFLDSQIGVIMAIFCTITMILQPLLGNLTDRVKGITWKKMAIFLGVLNLFICFLMYSSSGKVLGVITIGLFCIVTNLISPFINSAHFYYKNLGEYINFGVARGTGSALYAIAALILGFLVKEYGYKVVPVSGFITTVILMIIVISLPYTKKEVENHQDTKKTKRNLIGFLKKYPIFTLMILGVLCMFFSHNIIAIYLLQIIQSLGGDSSNLGTALALQASVEIPILFIFTILMKKIKLPYLMIIASFGYLLKAYIYIISKNIIMLYMAQLTQICSFALLAAGTVYYAEITVKEEDQTTAQSLMTGMMSAGMVLGALLGGSISQKLGIKALLIVNIIISVVSVFIAITAGIKTLKKYY